MENSIQQLGKELLKEGQHTKFRNERRKFHELVDAMITTFPGAMSAERTLREPYRTIAFLAVIGQRPITSILILEILLEHGKPLNGKEIGEKLAERLSISPALTTRGGNYEDRIGSLVSTFVKIGILELVLAETGRPKEEGFRIRKTWIAEVEAFIECIKSRNGVLRSLSHRKIEELFKTRFDDRFKYVVKSGTARRQQFSIGKIIKSLLNPKLGVSFETAVRVVEEIEPELKQGMNTIDIQSALYNAIKKHDEKAAESYRLTYPKIQSMTMSDGEKRTVNYRLVKELIGKEAKLKLTGNLLDQFASTTYNVITRNPGSYEHETAVREYIDALIRSECMPIRSDSGFVRDHLKSARSALDGCQNSLQSDEVAPARGLFEQFVDHICLVTLVEFGYLPFKSPKRNVDLISNLLKQGELKREIETEFKMKEEDLFQFQRIRFMHQMRDTASRRTLEKLISEGERLVAQCEQISRIVSPRIKPRLKAIEVSEPAPSVNIPTGYSDLDDLMFGGIPENYAVLLASPSCDERDLLTGRFLETGVGEGEIAVHITIDAKGVETLAQEFPSTFYLFICNPEADAIVKSLPNVYKLNGVENLNEIDITLTAAFRKIDKINDRNTRKRRACIAIISDVLLQHHAVSTRRWLTALIPKLKSRGFTTLAVVNPHMHSPQEVQAILDLFQGEIQIYKRKTEKGFKPFLRIEKMHNQDYIEEEIPLKKDRIRK